MPLLFEYPVVNQAWLDQSQEAALEPGLPIIDPHHHLGGHWGGGYDLAQFTADLTSGHAIRATVFIECGWNYRPSGPAALAPVGETEAVAALAAEAARRGHGGVCAGIVGFADLSLGDAVAPVLHAHVAAGQGRLRGIRQAAATVAEIQAIGVAPRRPGILGDPGFRTGFAWLERLGLSFEIWVYQPQLAEALDLARTFPGVTMVLNHLGGPLGLGPYGADPAASFTQWRQGLASLAGCANVVVKLGGLGMATLGANWHLQPLPPHSEALAAAWRPWLETAIELFGPARCMFESNFPIDKASCGYVPLWNAFKHVTAACSATEKAALFHDTAARVYGVGRE